MRTKNLLVHSCLLVSLTFIGCNSQSQESATQVAVNNQPINENEITWEPTIEEAFKKAKALNKPVFVECFLPTCPVCISMEPFFKKPEVAKKYNTSFVNYKMDLSKPDAKPYLDAKGIYLPSFPTFLFFDANGKLIHKDEVETSVESFNNVADKVLDPKRRAENFSARFKEGERSVPFLVEYAAYTRVIMDTTANLAAASALYEAYPKADLGSEESWKITKKTVTDLDNGFSKYWFNNVAKAAAFEKTDGHAGNEQNILGGILQASLYSTRGRKYTTARLQDVKKYMGLAGAAQYADGVTWEYEVDALIREGKAAQATVIGNKMATAFKDNGAALIYVTKKFNDVYPDKAYVTAAKKWLATAKPTVTDPKGLAEFYLESARLNQRNGDKSAALADAKQAQGNAVQAKLPLDRFSSLMNSVQ